jgi:hypothetical protein
LLFRVERTDTNAKNVKDEGEGEGEGKGNGKVVPVIF